MRLSGIPEIACGPARPSNEIGRTLTGALGTVGRKEGRKIKSSVVCFVFCVAHRYFSMIVKLVLQYTQFLRYSV